MKNKSLINVIFTLVLQFVTIVSGFIIPKIIIYGFGSDANGLISSITQFLNYINLIEGGISSVIMATMYKPLQTNDRDKINAIVVTTIKFFRKISLFFILYSIVLSIFYPIFINSKFSFAYVSSMIWILSVSLFIRYFFSLTWQLLLQADQKVYISSLIQIIVVILNTFFTVISIKIYKDLHFVKIISSLAFLIQPVLFKYFIRKYYTLNLSVSSDNSVLKHRWAGFGINLAAFFNLNTDVTVLTFFSTLANVSIYTVYSLVSNGIKSIITAISAGIVPTLGHTYAEGNQKKLNEVFHAYEFIIFFSTFSIFTVAIVTIVPFVKIYTKGVNDANYVQPVFSVLLLISMGIFCLREPYVNMAYSAGRFKESSKYAYVETIINIILSFFFVYNFGLNGVAFGTLISMTYRTLSQVFFLKSNILFNSPKSFFRKIFIHLAASLLSILTCNLFINYNINTWLEWIYLGFQVSLFVILFQSIFSLIFFRDSIKNIRNIKNL